MALSDLNSAEIMSIGALLQEPAEKYGNDANLEMQWAMKAYQHAETYFGLVSAIDPSILKLTPKDDDIYTKFRESFKDYKVDVIDENEMKSPEGKEKWREFINQFEKQVEDWNMGTLCRKDASKDISDENTMLVPRIQFLAIEIARNREGYNKGLREKYGKKKTEETS